VTRLRRVPRSTGTGSRAARNIGKSFCGFCWFDLYSNAKYSSVASSRAFRLLGHIDGARPSLSGQDQLAFLAAPRFCGSRTPIWRCPFRHALQRSNSAATASRFTSLGRQKSPAQIRLRLSLPSIASQRACFLAAGDSSSVAHVVMGRCRSALHVASGSRRLAIFIIPRAPERVSLCERQGKRWAGGRRFAKIDTWCRRCHTGLTDAHRCSSACPSVRAGSAVGCASDPLVG